MGVQDRDYVRDAPWPDPVRSRTPLSAVAWLCIANGLVFLLWQIIGGSPGTFMWRHFTVSAQGVLSGYLHTPITAAFSHEGLIHLLFNLLFLWWFGKELERIYGRGDFVLLYLLAGSVASLAHVGQGLLLGGIPPALGASGSVMGIVVLAACHFPDRRIWIWGVFPVALKWLAAGFVLLDLFAVVGGQANGVANVAHLGGAVTGFAWYALDLRILGRRRGRSGTWRERIAHLARRLAPGGNSASVGPEHGPVGRPGPAPVDPETDRRVDELLEKISREGITALSEEEADWLREASRRYRD